MPKFLLAMVNALYEYRTRKMVAATALAESLTLQVLMCVVAFCFGSALRLTLEWHQYFVLFPIIAFVMNIPVTPSGVGTTEWASSELFVKMGQSSDAGIAFMLLLRLNILCVGLPGGLLYLLPGVRVTRAQLAAEKEEMAQLEREEARGHAGGGAA